MPKKPHPLVQKTKLELQRLDKEGIETWGERKSYKGSLLPISVEPKLRSRAFSFMHDLIVLIESNGHEIKTAYNRLHIEMYGQLTEFNLRQKYYRVREKGDYSFSHNIFVKSEDLEFQILEYPRKNWVDKKTKTLEDYLSSIYDYVEGRSKEWAEHRKLQKNQKEKEEVQRKLEEEKERLIAIENKKTETLVQNATNYQKAHEIRIYLTALEEKLHLNQEKDENLQKYINWGYDKVNEIDPLFDKD